MSSILDRIIAEEQERYDALGLETIVTPVHLTISDPLVINHLSNDTYVLTGVRLSADELLYENTIVQISSATDLIECTMRELSMLGTSANRLFRGNMIVKTFADGKGFDRLADIQPYRLDFIRISPIIKP